VSRGQPYLIMQGYVQMCDELSLVGLYRAFALINLVQALVSKGVPPCFDLVYYPCRRVEEIWVE
jgi:hypothetical protein